MQPDWPNSTLSPVVHGDIPLGINIQYNITFDCKLPTTK